MFKFLKSVLNLVFPELCFGCGEEGSYFCQKCLGQTKKYKSQFCPICRKPTKLGRYCLNCRKDKNLKGIIVGANFDDRVLQRAIHFFKYESVKNLAGPLANLYPYKILKGLAVPENSLLIPVPTHKSKLKKRGYNQAEILARKLDKNLKIGVEPDILTKLRNTKSQMTLTKSERLVNMKNSFLCTNPKAINGKTIILVDDVCTTGTTLEECARALSLGNPKTIWGTVLARGN